MTSAERVAAKYAAVLTKEWLMGVRRTWLKLMDPPIGDWDDVHQAYQQIALFLNNLKDEIFYSRRGPFTGSPTMTEGAKVLKLLRQLAGAVDELKSKAKHWQNVQEGKTPAGGGFRQEEGEEMLARYRTNFPGTSEISLQSTGGKWRSTSPTELMDKVLKLLREDATRIKEHDEKNPETPFEDTSVYKEFDLHGMKVVIDDSTILPGEIKEYIKYLDEAYERLKQKGFGKVWYGTIFVKCKDCGGTNQYGPELGVGGNYPIGPDVVNVFSRPSKFIVELVVHELGHRYWFKFMSQGQRGKFEELINIEPPKPPELERLIPESKAAHAKQMVDLAYDSLKRLLKDFGSSRLKWWVDILKKFEDPMVRAAYQATQDLITAMQYPSSWINTPETKKLHEGAIKASAEVSQMFADMDSTIKGDVHKAPEPATAPADLNAYWLYIFKPIQKWWIEDATLKIEGAITAAYIYIDTSILTFNENEKNRNEEATKKWIERKREMRMRVPPVSNYGGKHIDEAWAEAFAHYVNGEDMTRDQIDSFKSVLKTASNEVAERLAGKFRWAQLHKRAVYDDHTLEILLAGIGILMAQAIVVTNTFFDEKEIRKFLSLRRMFHSTYAQACNDLADAFEQGEYGHAVEKAVEPLRAIARLNPRQDQQALRQLTKLMRVLYPARHEISGDVRIQRLIAFAKHLNSVQEANDRYVNSFFEQLVRFSVLPAPLRTMFRKIVKLQGYTKINETANPGAWFDMTSDQQDQIRETAERVTKEQTEAFEKHKDDPEKRREVYERTSNQLQKLQNAAGVNLQIISKKDEESLDTVLKRESKLQPDGPTEYTAKRINAQLTQFGMRDRKEGEGVPREIGKVLTQISKARTYDTMSRIVREAAERDILPDYMIESVADDIKKAGKNRAVREGRQLVPIQWEPKTPEEFKKEHDTGVVELPEGASEKDGKEMLGRISRALSDLEGIFGKGFCGKHAKKLAFRLGGTTSITARASYFAWDNKNEWQPRVTFGEDYEGLLAHELSHYFEDLLSFKLGPLAGKARDPDWKPPYSGYAGSGNVFGNTGVPMDRVVTSPHFEATRKELGTFIPEALEFAQAVVATPDYKRWQDKVGSAIESTISEAVQVLTGKSIYDLPKDHPYAKALDVRYKSELPPELLAKAEELYKKWNHGDDRKLTYYESATEVWARMCEQYVYTKLSKVGIANPWLTQLTYDIDVMDQFMEEKTFDEVMVPVMDRLFESLGVRNFIARRQLLTRFARAKLLFERGRYDACETARPAL